MTNELHKFNDQLLELLEQCQGKLASREVVQILVGNATSLALFCAPNPLEGMKAILESVEIGIKDYEDTKSSSDECK